MKRLKKTQAVFTWIVLGVAIANLLVYFMPMFQSVYRGGEPEFGYLYGSSSSYLIVSFTNLIIPITAIIFLFAKFKNSKLFFFGFSLTYIFNSIFTIISLNKAITENDNDYYVYSFKYGYYFYIVTTVLLAVSAICLFIFYLIIKKKEANEESGNISQAQTQDSQIDLLKKRIDILNDLKTSGVLTESEYEQKRLEIIKDLKL